jgi:phosphate:Na+ symporter
MVQLLIFHLTDYAFVFVGLGVAMALLTHHSQRRSMGQACFGVSLVILGLAALEAGGRPLAASPTTVLVFDALIHSPVVLALIGMLLTMIFASSIAGIGLVMVLASNGSLPLSAALALMLGSNVGSTVTAMLTALSRGSVAGRRLALIHTGTNLAVALIVLSLLGPLSTALSSVPLPTGTLVALSHLGFNLVLVILFVPLAGSLARLVEGLIAEQADQEARGPRYLDPETLVQPAVALGQALREVLHMTDLLTDMLTLGIHAFEDGASAVSSRLAALDGQLDDLNTAIECYLTQLDEQQMTGEQKGRQMALLYLITDLEEMGDLVDKHWMRLARRKRRKQLVFSEEGWQDLVSYHREVLKATQQAFAALALQDPQLAAEFFKRKERLDLMKRELHLRHVQRLRAGVPSNLASSALHLDLLNALREVLSHASTIAHLVQEDLSGETKGRSSTPLLKNGIARPPVTGKETAVLGVVRLQALEKGSPRRYAARE